MFTEWALKLVWPVLNFTNFKDTLCATCRMDSIGFCNVAPPNMS